MSKASDVIKEVNKEYKRTVVSQGTKKPQRPRLQSGVFGFDAHVGGGFPEGAVTTLYGRESSGKTTLSLLAIAQAQIKYPKKKAVFVDVEGHFDEKWAKRLGVDIDALVYVLPDYAEQAVDITDKLSYASDVSIIVVDSLAAFIGANEVDSSAEKAVVGGSALIIGKLYRKLTRSRNWAEQAGAPFPTTILINQIREKIGVMHGSPETLPGGNAFKFGSSLTVRINGKDEVEKAVNPDIPTWKRITCIVKKYKMPVLATNFEFYLSLLDQPARGIRVGQANEWKAVEPYLRKGGYLAKGEKDKGWVLYAFDATGEFFQYDKLEECKAKFLSDPEYQSRAKEHVMNELIEANNG